MTIVFFHVNTGWAAKASLVYDGDIVGKTTYLTAKDTEYLSLKTVAGVFKAQTQWFPVAKKVALQVRNRKITFTMDKKAAEMGTERIGLEAPVRYIDGTIYVPASFFCSPVFTEIVDCDVKWNADTLTLSAQPTATLRPPRVLSRTASTRIVFESTEPMDFSDKLSGRTLSLEVPKARIAKEETIRVKDSVISSISMEKARKGAVLNIELAQPVTHYRATVAQDPFRLIVQVRNPKATEISEAEDRMIELIAPDLPKAAGEKIPADPLEKLEPPKEASEKKTEAKDVKIVKRGFHKIAVDAGHGGEDTGAIGKSGTKEKDINLLVALELAHQLRLEGYDVFLTRKSDTFISLGDRSLLANQEGADLFISIHCNAAAFKKSEGGFEIYFLSEDATDQHAEDVARFENMEPERSGLTGKNKRAAEVLFSMARTEFINESSLLCHMISRAVDRRVPIDNRGVKQADFHVLHGVQMPSILVEVAFIDKSSEERKLQKRSFRSAMVDAIVTGVQNFESKVASLK